jgi:hypothetical protein
VEIAGHSSATLTNQARNDEAKVEIFDVFGRDVLSRSFSTFNTFTSFSTGFQFSIDNLPSGIYFVRVTTQNETITQNIIKN